jgi:hypothetical protein
MAENSSGIGLTGVIVGAVIVIAVAFFFFRGMGDDAATPDVTIEAPSTPAPAPAAPAPATP